MVKPDDSRKCRIGAAAGGAEKGNLLQAFKRVRATKGAAGVDGRDIDETSRYLAEAWPGIREQLLAGTYRPSPVRRVTIPKPDGGERELGIPTVTDRLIQQARHVCQCADAVPESG